MTFSYQQVRTKMKKILKTSIILAGTALTHLSAPALHAAAPGFAEAQKYSMILKDTNAPYIGAKNGRIIGAVFVDAQCGHCKDFKQSLLQVMPKFKDLRFNILEYPIFGQVSEQIGRASIAAADQGEGKYEKFVHALLQSGATSIDDIKEVATSVGLDTNKLVADMNSKEVTNKMGHYINLGKSLNVEGTPYVIIGDEAFPGAIPASALENKIEEASKKNSRA